MKRIAKILGVAWIALLVTGALARPADEPPKLAAELRPLLACLSGERGSFSISAKIQVAIEAQPQEISVRLVRYDGQAFDLELTHPLYSALLRRRATATAFALPHHK